MPPPPIARPCTCCSLCMVLFVTVGPRMQWGPVLCRALSLHVVSEQAGFSFGAGPSFVPGCCRPSSNRPDLTRQAPFKREAVSRPPKIKTTLQCRWEKEEVLRCIRIICFHSEVCWLVRGRFSTRETKREGARSALQALLFGLRMYGSSLVAKEGGQVFHQLNSRFKSTNRA